MKQLALINPENVSEQDAKKYSVRTAARAVVFDNENKVAVLHVTKYNYYKLPGGGVDEGESFEEAMRRECIEEIGCNVEVVGEVGSVLEYRKKYSIKQTSYCYVAKLVGDKGTPKLMEDEIEEGFQTVWLPIKDVLKKIRESQRSKYEVQYMTARDEVIIEAVIKTIK